MRKVLFALIFLGGCSQPLAPSTAVCSTDSDCAQWEAQHEVPEAERTYGDPVLKPQHHNIPATLPDGSIMFLCATQPRSYTTPDGQLAVEEDHYLQRESCPTIPIR